jgi:hypothetical protein
MDADFDAYTGIDSHPYKIYRPLGRINILVGATNSRKSRFVRALAKSPTITFIPDETAHAATETLLKARRALTESTAELSITIEVRSSSD